jgi:PAS domain S-box-containing protein/TyrR family helix-turn-helix protein
MDEPMQDVDQRAMSYEELSRQLNLIMDCSADGIWVLDHNTRVLNINKAAEQLNAIKAMDVIGKKVTELVDEGLFDRAISPEVLRKREQVTIYEKTKKTNKLLLYTGTPSFDENGNITHIVVNERDVTQLNNLRQELEQSRMLAEKFKDELAEKSLRESKAQGIIVDSKQMRHIMEAALKLARLEASNILIFGDSGTGKGLLANFIHQNSNRRNKPLIQINCAALPETLLEAELFGYEKGAFTGASEHGKAGLFELAQQGVLFLDEIGELPLPLQAKLLKYLDDHQIFRLGGTRSQKIDCMVIAATNRNLEKRVHNGKFRQDLFYRLNTFMIKIPPLRERPADIFELTNYYLSKYNIAYRQKKRISSKALEALLAYPFPGNVRELKNILKRAVVMSESKMLDEFIRANLVGNENHEALANKRKETVGSLTAAVERVEKDVLKMAMAQCKTTRSMAARLKVSHATVVRKMQKYGLVRSCGKN